MTDDLEDESTMAKLLEKPKTDEGAFPIEKIRQDFPVLHETVYRYPLVYFDNAATTQKPQAVIDRMTRFYEHEYGTVRRGVYALSEKATRLFEQARAKVSCWINSPISCQVVFTKGTTEAINLVASSYGRPNLCEGDEIIISTMEHHANLVPWQQLCLEKGAKLRVIPMTSEGELILEEYEKLLTPKTKLVAVTHVSNVLGTINPVKQMIAMAHHHGIPVLVDGAQAVAHMTIDVQDLDCDFYVFSSHKFYGPTGVGVLYAKMKHLDAMVPYQFGGEMIESVTFEKTTFAKPPRKFEAGTPPIAEVIGMAEAIDYVQKIGMDKIAAYEHCLLTYATERLSNVPTTRIIGQSKNKASVLSFVLDCVHPHDIGTVLDRQGVAIRVGHHCAQPLMEYLKLPATARASFAFYNKQEEIDHFIQGLETTVKIFRDHV